MSRTFSIFKRLQQLTLAKPDQRRQIEPMIMQIAHERLDISVQTRTELDEALNQAQEILKPMATSERVGILVTRLAPGRYQARLDPDLPPGTTRESWDTLSHEAG